MTDDKSKQTVASDKDEEISDESLKKVAGGAGRPPSGDSNPSDLDNGTVGSGDIINPHPAK